MKRVLIVFLALVMILSVVTGCGSTADTKGTGAATTSTVSAEATATAGTADTTGSETTVTAKKGGNLNIIVRRPPVKFGYPPNVAGGDRDTIPPVFERLLCIDDKGEYKPELAASWNYSEDGKTLTFKLREGIKFHDGTDFNAEAVKLVFESLIPPQSTIIMGVSSVEAVDTYTVKFNLSEYNNLILYQIASAYECYIYSPTAVKEHDKDWANTHPIGTGPFKFDSYEKDTSLKLVKNPDYWQKGLPNLDSITWLIITDGMTQALSYKAGDADAIFDVGTSVVSTLKDEGAIIKKAPGAVYALTFDSKNNPALSDPRVRQAIEYAIDKKAICSGTGLGLYEPAYQVVPSNSPSYNPNCEDRTYNLEKAKQLLAEAGYANGLTIDCFFLDTYWRDGITAVQAYLAKAGITLNMNFGNQAAYNDIRIAGKIKLGTASQMTMNVFSNSLFAMDFYWKANPDNFKYIKTPAECDPLIKQAKSAKNQDEVNKITQQISKILYDDETIIPLWVNPRIVVMNKAVKDDGFFVNGDSNNIKFGTSTWLDK